MKSKVKIVFVGAGKISEEHIKVFKKINKVELCGIYSRTKLKSFKLAKKYKIKNVYNSIDEMYANTKADLVVVSVSIESTKSVCMKISKYSWKCLVEKPFGYNYKECKELINKIAKKQFYLALNRTNYSSTIGLLNILKKDKSQRIINISDQQSTLKFKNKFPKKILENFMYANSIHLVDYVRIFARGKINSIKTMYDLKKNKIRIFSKKINFSSGDVVIFNSIWNKPGPWSVNISTDNFFFEMCPLEQLKYRNKKDNKIIEFNINKDDIRYKPGFMRQANEMIKAIDRKKFNIPSSDDAYKTIKLIKKIF
ncbi:Gfo/Idh/MocA family oxidoreductase [Candidatus Pelagibacter sp.]|nr:Gfo/Idh/MocA family oxidoreductase [Candidatus Pelagibacter sp.]